MTKTATDTPAKWHDVYRNDEEKCVFVGKDGSSGLIRAKDKATGKHYEWRSTDALSRESGLSKKRVEEILDHWTKKGVVRQHAKDPEKWGYWEIVGAEKDDPDPIKKDHDDRVDKASIANGKPRVSQATINKLKALLSPNAGQNPSPAPAPPKPATNPTSTKPAPKPTGGQVPSKPAAKPSTWATLPKAKPAPKS